MSIINYGKVCYNFFFMFEVYGLEIVFLFGSRSFWWWCKTEIYSFRFDNHQYLDIIHQEDPIRAYHQIQNCTHSQK